MSHIYELTRRRLLEITYFPTPEVYAERYYDEDFVWGFIRSDEFKRIGEQEGRLRGTSGESQRYVLAEIFFRAQNPELQPKVFLHHIKLAVKITGPLNAPPVNLPIWYELNYIFVMQSQINRMRKLTRANPEDIRDIIKRFEGLITSAQKRLRQAKRAAKKGAGSEAT